MRHQPYVCLVYAHSESVGGDYDVCPALFPLFLAAVPFLLAQAGVVEICRNA